MIRILDIGSAICGLLPRYHSLVVYGLAEVTTIDPSPDAANMLRRIYGERGTVHQIAVGDPGRRTLHRTRFPGCCSFFEPDPAVVDRYFGISTGEGGNFSVVGAEEVDIVAPPLVGMDFLQLDVQGMELEILRRLDLSECLVAQVEVEFAPIYKGQPLAHDVMAHMTEQGFALCDFIDPGRYTLRSDPFGTPHLLWADAVFIRPDDWAGWTPECRTMRQTILSLYGRT